MLYDKKWDSQPKTVEPSLKGMIAWLETKDPKEKYDFVSKECACAQYFQAIGYTDYSSLLSWNIERHLGMKPNTCGRYFAVSDNFGELLSHLKRLDSQPA